MDVLNAALIESAMARASGEKMVVVTETLAGSASILMVIGSTSSIAATLSR